MLDVSLASPQRHRNLTVYPLVAGAPAALPYGLMVDALHAGTLRVTEVGTGTVPELHAVNEGPLPVLILDGEQLIGARQNRTTSRSLLLGAGSRTHIPVSCMEQGRWHFRSDAFGAGTHNSPTNVRRQAREVEAQFAREGATVPRHALAQAQGMVWSAISAKSRELGTVSATGALNDLYDASAADLGGWVAEYPHVENQVGLLAFLGLRPLGMDVVGGTNLYPRLHERLLHGYVMDALGTRAARRRVPVETAQAFLDRVREARRVPSPTPGEGRYSVLAGQVIGGELADRGRVVHLSAFPDAQLPGRDPSTPGLERPIAPPSRRRRRDG